MLDEDVLPALLARRAEEQPDAVLVQEVGGGEITFRGLHELTLAWAAAYRGAGVGAGDRVATLMPTCIDAYATWLGAARLRAIEVPVNTAYRGAWLEHILLDSGARVGVVHSSFLDRVVEVASALPPDVLVVVPDTDEIPAGLPFRAVGRSDFLAMGDGADGLEPVLPSDICCIVYTSGTTGRSKGVLMHWGQMHASFQAALPSEASGPDLVYYSPFPPYHVTGKTPLYSAIAFGSRVVIRDVFSTASFWDDIREYRCTATLVVGAMANFLVQQPPQPGDADTPLKYAIMAPVVPDVEVFAERFDVKVCTGYSMTELSMPLISDGFNVTSANFRSCGRPRAGFEVRVVDEHDHPVPPGQIGELVIRNDEPWTLMGGYWGQPEATAAAWRNLWFHTGDSFMVDEHGDYYFVDRQKDAIRRRGENISSFEVEAVVNSHPDVMESAAVAVPSLHTEDDVKIVVVPVPGATVEPESLLDYLIPRMPRFAVPRYIDVVEALPKTPTARVQKAVLREAGVTDSCWDRDLAGVTVPR